MKQKCLPDLDGLNKNDKQRKLMVYIDGRRNVSVTLLDPGYKHLETHSVTTPNNLGGGY